MPRPPELARFENKADVDDGAGVPESHEPDVAAVLASMAQQGTMNCSAALAERLVPALGSVAPLVKPRPTGSRSSACSRRRTFPRS